MNVGELMAMLGQYNPNDLVYVWGSDPEDPVELEDVAVMEEGGILLSADEETEE